jgi:hypothetical protein
MKKRKVQRCYFFRYSRAFLIKKKTRPPCGGRATKKPNENMEAKMHPKVSKMQTFIHFSAVSQKKSPTASPSGRAKLHIL